MPRYIHARTGLIGAAAALCFAGVLAGCGTDSKNEGEAAKGKPAKIFEGDSTMAKVQQRGELRVGIKFDAPLFGLKDPRTDNIQGFDAEMGRLIAKDLLGSPDRVKFIETSSKNRELFLNQNRVDVVLATYSITPERERVVDFAGPYYEAGKALLIRKGGERLNGLNGLAGKQVCTVEGTTDEEMLRKDAPDADVVVFDAWSLCAEALRDKRVDAILSDNTVLLSLMQASPEKFEFAGAPFTKDFYGIGIGNDNAAFLRYLNSLLKKAEENGEWKSAYEKTVGTVEDKAPQPPAIGKG